jgi:hypothetical protein
MKDLNKDQMEILYYNFLISPNDGEIKEKYAKHNKDKKEIEDIKELGWNEEELKNIEEAISNI